MSQLQEYVSSQVATISPFKVKSQELLEIAIAQEVEDDKTAKEAVKVRKAITAHRSAVKKARLEITRNFDSVKSQFIEAEKDVLAPAEEALENISKKMIAYQEEQERLAREEAERVSKVCATFSTDANSYKTQKACDERGAELKEAFAKLSDEDQNNATIKLAFTEAINSLLTRKSELSSAQVDEAQQAKLQAQRNREIEAAKAEAASQQAAQGPTVKAGIKTKKVFTITSPALVPREFCEPSDKLIRAAMAKGAVSIPGVEISEVKAF